MSNYTTILSGQSWNALSALRLDRKPVFLTYTFNAPFGWDSTKFGSADKAVAQKASKMWGDACGIRFIEVKGEECRAEVSVGMELGRTASAWAEFPELTRDTFGRWDGSGSG